MGGGGLDTISFVLMMEEVARVDAAHGHFPQRGQFRGTAASVAVGSDAQKKKYLTRMAAGEILGAFCLTEPQAGSDAAGIQTRAVKCECSYRSMGRRLGSQTVASPVASSFSRRRIRKRAGRALLRFSSSRASKAFALARHEEKMGQLSSPSVEIILNDCEVPADNRLGEEGQGLKIALSALDGGRIASARWPWGWRKVRSKNP